MVKHISSGSPFEAKIGYSRAVVDGDMVYVSGSTGYDYETMELPGDVREQARNTLENVRNALSRAGCSIDDVVRVRYYVAERGDVAAIVPLLGEAFAKARPAATMLITGLIEPEMKIEIEVTARVGVNEAEG